MDPHQICGCEKPGRIVGTPDVPLGCAAIPVACQKAGDLGRQDSSKAKQRQMPSPTPGEEETPGTHLYRLDGVWVESCIPVKVLGILVNT